jgi:hypothetical protein
MFATSDGINGQKFGKSFIFFACRTHTLIFVYFLVQDGYVTSCDHRQTYFWKYFIYTLCKSWMKHCICLSHILDDCPLVDHLIINRNICFLMFLALALWNIILWCCIIICPCTIELDASHVQLRRVSLMWCFMFHHEISSFCPTVSACSCSGETFWLTI